VWTTIEMVGVDASERAAGADGDTTIKGGSAASAA
jgi:hypothetical protein